MGCRDRGALSSWAGKATPKQQSAPPARNGLFFRHPELYGLAQWLRRFPCLSVKTACFIILVHVLGRVRWKNGSNWASSDEMKLIIFKFIKWVFSFWIQINETKLRKHTFGAILQSAWRRIYNGRMGRFLSLNNKTTNVKLLHSDKKITTKHENSKNFANVV